MKEILLVFKDINKIKKVFFATLICLIIDLIFKKITSMAPPFSDIEFINPLAPALGLYLGPIGSLAMSFAYFILSAFEQKYSMSFMVMNTMFVFVYSYLPFKMWYTIGRREFCKIPNLDDARSILKYICILCLNSITITTAYYAIFSINNSPIIVNITIQNILFYFFNSVSLPILLGIPAMVLFSVCGIGRVIPILSKYKNTTKYYIFVWSVFVISSMLILVSDMMFGKENMKYLKCILIILIHISILLYINLPFTKRVDTSINSSNRDKITMRGKVTLAFLCAGFILISLNVLLFWIVLRFVCNDFEITMRVIYISIGICTFYIFGLILLALKYVEIKVTIPLDKLSNAVSVYSKIKSFNNKDSDEDVKKLCKSINSKNEIEDISKEFLNMIDKVDESFANSKRITEEREREKVEIDLASKIQEAILPKDFPAFADRNDFDISASMTAAKKLGGDFYDFFLTENNKLCFLIGDVSGKGIPAALVMMSAKTVIKDYLSMNLEIEEVVKKVNMKLCKDNDVFMFITTFLAVVDLDTGIMEYVSAGHNPPLFRKNNQKFEYLGVKSNCILAVDYYAEFVKQTINLQHGDVIFLYTDGVTEALNKNGMFYGNERLLQALNKKYYDDIYQIIPYIKSSISEFTEDYTQSDDITMLIFKYK